MSTGKTETPSAMATATPRLHELFGCTLAESYVTRIPPAENPAQQTGTRHYAVLTISGSGLKATGSLAISLEPEQPKQRLIVDGTRRLPGNATRHLHAEILCRADTLKTPTSWSLREINVAADGSTRLPGAYSQSADVSDSTVHCRTGSVKRTFTVDSKPVHLWGLLAGMGHPREANPLPESVTLLANMDRPKTGLRLHHAGSKEVLLGGKREIIEDQVRLEKGRLLRPRWGWTGGQPLTVEIYQLTGPGMVPWVIYVDRLERTLFLSAGIEAYCLVRPPDSPSAASRPDRQP